MPQSHCLIGSGVKHGRPIVRTALWLLLGGWFGGFLLFGAVVAPTAFAILPTSQIAGTLVGPVLTKLHLFGAAAGIPIAALSHMLGRRHWLAVVPVLLSALCCYSHFGVSAELAEIRMLTFSAAGSADLASRFGFLHRVSIGIFIAVGVCVTALIGLHAHADAQSATSG